MKEHPIIFNPEMVRAIMDGRKSQTRRLMRVQPKEHNHSQYEGAHWQHAKPEYYDSGDSGWICQYCGEGMDVNGRSAYRSPYGAAGDQLWVRETWWQAGNSVLVPPYEDEYQWSGSRRILYAVDGNPPNEPNRDYPNGLLNGAFSAAEPNKIWRKRPSIHMPRWASRTTLNVLGVRIERLHDITEHDALLEGVDLAVVASYERAGVDRPAAFAFRDLWISTGGDWESNPWVWVYDFEVAKHEQQKAA